ncbi:MAG: Adenylate cyclase [uncultured Solirubrobacteraceae bacterium]|uniref:Adenylate cyclase n=1 Tax=uncultured Solirubrobacteraceae bacterium TaxID=1162706 RepID=A0A6J4RQC5_9ACTN|nr:MAG: Adenylate cyclase [uncultured Solirubrobacteraceae bacterium]
MARANVSPFGALLRRHRLAAGLTQEALAERARVSPKAVSDLERDAARAPRFGTVGLLADALGLTPELRAGLLAAARPRATPAGAPTTSAMPRPLTRLVGRTSVVAALAELMGRDEIQLLTLTGPGGVGKTRVAIEVARRMAAHFPDGVVFVDLAALQDSALVLAAIAHRLGVDERDATSLHDGLAASLRDKQVLLLLDNFERVVAAGQAIVRLLEACPRLVVLVTSRVALQLRGGLDYPIAPLVLPEPTDAPESLLRSPAVELFVDLARASGAELRMEGQTPGAVAEICRRLDGVPLAIELAAAKVRFLPPPVLLARVEKRLPLLERGRRDLPARQKTMRDAIAWSYELLEAPEQALFRRVCVFAGGGTLDAAEVVCRQDPSCPPIIDGLATLVDNSLLQTNAVPADEGSDVAGDAPRLLVLETLREYGLEQLESHGETDDVCERHATYYLGLAEEAARALGGPDGAAWLARLDREHDNMQVALRWMGDRRDGPTALRLAGALWRFWQRRGHLSEGRRWLREALELRAAASTIAVPVELNALAGAATLEIDQAAYDEAEAHIAEAVTIAREQAAPSDLAAALNLKGLLAREQARYADSVRYHQEALSLAREAEDPSGEATALLGLAQAQMFNGDAAEASVVAREGLALARERGDSYLLARALILVAWQAAHTGRYKEAEGVAGEARSLLGADGEIGEYAEALFLSGAVALFRGEHERAASFFNDSLTFNRTRGAERRWATDLGGLAAAALNLGDTGRARTLAEESLTLARRYRDLWSAAMSLSVLGHVDLAEGDAGRARELFAEASDLFHTIGNLIYLPWCLDGLAGVAAARGHYERAAELGGAVEAMRREVGFSVPPIHPLAHARVLATVRESLSQETFDAAQAAGEARPPEHTIAAALLDE